MKYMLDTNICIYLINECPKSILKKHKTALIKDTAISSIVLSELTYGACKSQFKEKNLLALMQFTIPIEVIPYDDHAAYHYGEIRALLEKKGKLIGSMDMMIAAHAVSMHATLVTNNLKEFSRVEGLRCENWC